MKENDLLRFFDVMRKNFPTIIVNDIRSLVTLAVKIGKLNLAWANGNIDEETFATKVAKHDAGVSAILTPLGATYELNGDPRGYAVYIHLPDGQSNSWGGLDKGWGI